MFVRLEPIRVALGMVQPHTYRHQSLPSHLEYAFWSPSFALFSTALSNPRLEHS